MRTSPLSFGLTALALSGFIACEPAAPPVAPNAAPSPPPPSPAAVAAPAYDLSPVAEPAGLVGILRWKNPSATLSTLSGCAGVPAELAAQGEKSLLTVALRDGLRGQVDAGKLADAVATDAPVDLVVALDPNAKRPQPIVAFSLGLASLDNAKAAATGASLVEVSPGMWRVGEKERRGLSCVFAVATGPTPARLVCGEREKHVIALGPYLTRTLPTTAPSAANLHGEIRYAPVDERYGALLRQSVQGLPLLADSQASIGDPVFDQALRDAAGAVSDEAVALTRDLDRLTIDLTSDPSACLTASLGLKLRDKSSWIAGAMLDRPDRAGPPPAIFWRAPKDSDSAVFSRNGDPARLHGILKTLRAMLESGLASIHIGSPDDRRALAELIAAPLSKNTTMVQAGGHIQGPAFKVDGSQTLQQTLGAFVQSLGWSVFGFDEGPAAPTKWLKDFVNVYGRRGLMDPLKKGLGSDARFLPVIRLVAAPAPLGKGALNVEIKLDIPPEKAAPPLAGTQKPPASVPKAAKPDRVTFALHILLMPDGQNTWLAFGANKDELVKHLLMSRSAAPESDSLASRTDLGALRSGKVMSGGFFSMSTFTRALSTGLTSAAEDQSVQEVLSALARMPHKGATPIIFTTSITAGSSPEGELTLKLSKGSAEDIAALAMGLAQQMGRAGTPMPAPPKRP